MELTAPGLGLRKNQEIDDRSRTDQVLPRQSRAVVEEIVVWGNAGIVQKSTKHFETSLNSPPGALFATEQAKQNFRMQVLADLVDDLHVLCERRGLIFRQNQRADRRGQGSVISSSAVRGNHYAGERRQAGQVGVACPLFSVNNDAADFQQMTEQVGSEFRRILDREPLVDT